MVDVIVAKEVVSAVLLDSVARECTDGSVCSFYPRAGHEAVGQLLGTNAMCSGTTFSTKPGDNSGSGAV